MIYTFPIGVMHDAEGTHQLLGTGFLADVRNGYGAIVTAQHILTNVTGQLFVAIPPHNGNRNLAQNYPVPNFPASLVLDVEVDLINDLAVLIIKDISVGQKPSFAPSPTTLQTLSDTIVVGFPFCVIGSLLETMHPATVVAMGRRVIQGSIGCDELVLSLTAHPGSSGSPVVRRNDGLICGVVKGSLAPQSMMRMGNIPIGVDTSVTYATSAHVVPSLVNHVYGRMNTWK